mmetsp:Transcript_9936/g.30317  ORF Transcript_9936/g.30317 Transcript_9936/m.30317 type:complete len:138 (+) Transcript_9936:109-522(+)
MGIFGCCLRVNDAEAEQWANVHEDNGRDEVVDVVGLEAKQDDGSRAKSLHASPDAKISAAGARLLPDSTAEPTRHEISEEEGGNKIKKWVEAATSHELSSLAVDPATIRNLEDYIYDEKTCNHAPPTDADRYATVVR